MTKYNNNNLKVGDFVTSRHLIGEKYYLSSGLIEGEVIQVRKESIDIYINKHEDLKLIGKKLSMYKENCTFISRNYDKI